MQDLCPVVPESGRDDRGGGISLDNGMNSSGEGIPSGSSGVSEDSVAVVPVSKGIFRRNNHHSRSLSPPAPVVSELEGWMGTELNLYSSQIRKGREAKRKRRASDSQEVSDLLSSDHRKNGILKDHRGPSLPNKWTERGKFSRSTQGSTSVRPGLSSSRLSSSQSKN